MCCFICFPVERVVECDIPIMMLYRFESLTLCRRQSTCLKNPLSKHIDDSVKSFEKQSFTAKRRFEEKIESFIIHVLPQKIFKNKAED